MARPKTIARLEAEKICKKFKNTPSLTLAKKLYKENNTLFKSVENARDFIRLIRGKSGGEHRSKTIDKSLFDDKERSRSPFNFPKSEHEERKPYILPVANNNILVISDLHLTFHNDRAIELAIQYGLDNNVNTIIINGDLLDFYSISRWEKDPRKRTLKHEIQVAREFLIELRRVFPNQKIVFGYGNHDYYYQRYMIVKAPELLDIEAFSLDEILGLTPLRIDYLEQGYCIKAGKLSILHGDTIMRGVFAPVNSARGTYTKVKQSALISHVHKSSEHTETNMDGEIVTCWSTGCLSELRPAYNPHANSYNHGFAHVVVSKDGNFSVKNIRIYKGKIL